MHQFRPNPKLGEKHRPYNKGNLGYTYTIYRFYDADDTLLYVGETARVRKRVVDHQMGNPRGLPLGHDDGPKPWWREAARIELEHLPPGTTEREAMLVERDQIERLRPIYNWDYNEEHFDRARRDRAIEYAHFEVDLATAEHERHDGVVRAIERIEDDAVAASDRVSFGAYSYTPNRSIGRGRYTQPRRRASSRADAEEDGSISTTDRDRTNILPDASGPLTKAVPTAKEAEAKADDSLLAPVEPTKPKGDFSNDGLGSTIALSVLVGFLIAALLAAGIVGFGML